MSDSPRNDVRISRRMLIGAVSAGIGFAAFGSWDAAGASWFGYRTAWVNRLGVPNERLGPSPAIVSRGIESVLALAGVV